ncbi:phosphoribosyltransferase [Compostibacter hankyongensis]|uniref:Hypoxanthine phosphoribosyltransferase n=1 Tax=Compostibacter hankyongensis TaxID=1007089 RepID=A0ABP8FYJ4_9BACT
MDNGQGIQVHDKRFEPYISAERLHARIREMAAELDKRLGAADRPLFLAILNGAFVFAADLFRALTIPAEISFIKLVSYKGTRSTGQVITAIGLDMDLFDRTVVIVEDIVDTGNTLHAFLPQLEHRHPRALLTVSLLMKPDAAVHPVPVDIYGFSIPNVFVVGYGLDYDGLGRNLPAIYRETVS